MHKDTLQDKEFRFRHLGYGTLKYKFDGQKLKIADFKDDINLTLKKGEKLSSISAEILELYKERILKGEKPQFDIKGGTGIGKTFAALEEIAPNLYNTTGHKSGFIAPLNILTNQCTEKREKVIVEAITGQKPSISKIEEALKNESFASNQNAFPVVASHVKDQGENLHTFLDESHTLISGMTPTYKPQTIEKLMQAVTGVAASTTLLSATPKDYFRFLGFERINIIQDTKKVYTVHKLVNDLSIEQNVLNHIANTDFAGNKKLVIKIQSKDKIESVYKILTEKYQYAENEVLRLYSSKDIKESPDYQKLIKADPDKNEFSFENDVKIVLCTSILNEGVNLYCQDTIEFVNTEKSTSFDYYNFVQFVARWRTDKDKTIYSYHPIQKNLSQVTDPYAHLVQFKNDFDYWTKKAKQLTEDVRSEQTNDSTKRQIINTYTPLSQNEKFLSYNKETNEFTVNYLQLTVQAEQTRRQYLQTNTAYKHLVNEFPYFVVVEAETSEQTNDSEQVTQYIQQQKETEKIELSTAKTDIAELLKSEPLSIICAVYVNTQSTSLKNKIEEHFIELFADKDKLKFEANKLKNDKPNLLSKHFSTLEHTIKNMIRAFELGFTRSNVLQLLLEDVEGETTLRTRQKLTPVFEKLKVLFLLTLGRSQDKEEVPLLTKTQYKDYQKIKECESELIDAFERNDNVLSVAKAKRITKKFFRGDAAKMTKKIVNILFVTERKGKYKDYHWQSEKHVIDELKNELGLTTYEPEKHFLQLVENQRRKGEKHSTHSLI